MDLAEAAELSRNHVQRIEAATAVPSLDGLLNIAQALDIPMQKLFDAR